MKGKLDRKRIIGFMRVAAKEDELESRGFKKVEDEKPEYFYKWVKEGVDEVWHLNYRGINGEDEPVLYLGNGKERVR